MITLTRQQRIEAAIRNAIAECKHKNRIITVDLENGKLQTRVFTDKDLQERQAAS